MHLNAKITSNIRVFCHAHVAKFVNYKFRDRRLPVVCECCVAISTGIYGYPIEDAAKIAVREVRAFLAASTSALCATADKENAEREGRASSWPQMEVIFCCFSWRDAAVYERLLGETIAR